MPMADQRAELVPLLKIVVLRYSYNSPFPVKGKEGGGTDCRTKSSQLDFDCHKEKFVII